ncbi:flagellar biosynthesis protein FliQ [Candidatus Sumerlaeota bacterium]|nr:flagellar biosynthesis protein FliQ [Candidatus Sumerlaeota bacterium]
METQVVVDILRQAFQTALLLAAPGLGFALIVGLIVSVLQTVTSIQEQTLVFVPKMVGVGAALLFFMSWMLGMVMHFTESLFLLIPELVK